MTGIDKYLVASPCGATGADLLMLRTSLGAGSWVLLC